MKILVLLTLFISVYSYHVHAETTRHPCSVPKGQISEDGDHRMRLGELKNLNDRCGRLLQEQISMEFNVSIAYMAMSAHFSSDSSFRPGLSKFFLQCSTETRMQARQIMEFLLMRGFPVGGAALPREGIRLRESSYESSWNWANPTAETALTQAYRLEKLVTESIENIIKNCESPTNDYHGVQYLTRELLAKQHQGLHTISEHITALKRLGSGTLAEVLFDKTLH